MRWWRVCHGVNLCARAQVRVPWFIHVSARRREKGIRRVVLDVANFNQKATMLGNHRVAIRLHDIGSQCFRCSSHVPHDYDCVSDHLGGRLGRQIAHNGIRLDVAVRGIRTTSTRIAIGVRLTHDCRGTLQGLSRGLYVGGSIAISALAHFPSILTAHRTSISRRRL